MGEWKTYRLGDLCDSISNTYRGKAQNVVLINTSDVLEGKCLNHRKEPNKNLKGQFKKTFQQGDILYSEIRPSNKRFAYIDFDATDYIASTKLMVLRANEKIRPLYLYYILQSQVVIDELQMLAESRSGTFPQITFSELSLLTTELPDIDSQDKIINILKSLDDKIELNRRINANLEAQAQALFRSWFVDFEPFRDGPFVDSQLGKIPQGWKVVELGDVTKQQTEKVGPQKTVKVLSPITTGELVLSEEYFTKQVFSESIAKYIIVKPNQFAYNPARINIGSIGRNTFEFDGCVSPVYVVFECEKGYHYFFDFFRKTDAFKQEVISRAIGGVRQTLGYKDFALIKVIYPPRNVVQEFNALYINLLNLQNHNDLEIKTLSALRDTLLPKLMAGEIAIE